MEEVVMRPQRRAKPAQAWVRKYFVAASDSWRDLEWDRRGMKDIRLISRPNQIDNQLEAVREMIGPSRRKKRNNGMYGRGINIKEQVN